jgi:phosphatidylglycerophosphatase A
MNRQLSKKVIISLVILCIAAACIGLYLAISNQDLCGVSTDNVMAMLSIGLGLGCMPLIPGTAGALGGVVLSLLICRLSITKQFVAVVLLILVAIPISDKGENYFASKDASTIVADELLTFPLATLGLPVHQYPVMLAGIFITNRIVDWTKPPPAKAAESIPGGVGIVLDDVVASLWALLIFSIGWRWYRRKLKQNLVG